MPVSRPLLTLALLLLAALACSRTAPQSDPGGGPVSHVTVVGGGEALPVTPHTSTPNSPIVSGQVYPTKEVVGTPTPDATRPSPRSDSPQGYIVQPGDTLGSIAERYSVTVAEIMTANNLQSDVLSVGQQLTIPAASLAPAPDYKIIPDSELVYSPSVIGFDVEAVVNRFGGYLASYVETDRDGVTRTGAQTVQVVAERYSVNPRLLLALLEHMSGWVTIKFPPEDTLIYPFGHFEPGKEGLLRQLSWAADELNAGYYGWRENKLAALPFNDGGTLAVAPSVNAGTVALQYFFTNHFAGGDWMRQVQPGGFDLTYSTLFGNPFAYAFEPLMPTGLAQPALDWPFEKQEVWYFTGGPHGGWDSGSAWAALDFAPDTEGCQIAEQWVVAAADGLIARSGEGAVLQDLDGDGFEQTGWTLFYMHIGATDRVSSGTFLRKGDRVGHPSCEGGFSNGTHLHFARKYNGEWVAADGAIPFNLAGWTMISAWREYDGWLRNGDTQLEAQDLDLALEAGAARRAGERSAVHDLDGDAA
ncbi:MAG: LysM peptidoglycan-binding domain-containing protein, partial [Chloroflexi bacterium]|nr:LysM peptidoglycan-binding domain-containing protein [Chloroflexota bacterium]